MGNTIIGTSNNITDEEVAGGRPYDQSENDDVFYDTVTEDDYTSVVVGVRPKFHDPRGEDDPVQAPPREDDPILDPLYKGDPAPAPPREGDPALAQPREYDLSSPREGDTVLAPPHKDDPALVPLREDDPVLAPSRKDDPALALPHKGDPKQAPPHEGDPALAPPHEGVPALALQNGGYQLDAPRYKDEPQVGWTGLTAMTQPMDEFITMEWECDTSDPFERALARRSRPTTTQAESQMSTTEDKKTHTLWQAMKKLETGGGQQDRKAPQYYPDEATEQDREHNSKTLQHYLDYDNGKNSRTPQHYTGEREEKDGKTPNHYIDEDEDNRTLQHYTDEEGKNGKALQHYPFEEDSKNVKAQSNFPYETKGKDVKTSEDKDCRTLRHYPYEEKEKDGKTMQQNLYEEKVKNYRAQHHYPYEEEDKENGANYHHPYQEEEKICRAQHHYPYEGEDKEDRANHHHPSEEEEKNCRAQHHCPHEEEAKEDRVNHHHPYQEEDKNCRAQHHYPYKEEDREDRANHHHPCEEEVKAGKTHHHFSYEEEDKNDRVLQHYLDEEDKDGRRVHHCTNEEKGKVVRTQHRYPYKEEDKDGRTLWHYTDDDEDDETLHHYLYKKEEKDGRALLHYPYEEEERNGKTQHHYPYEEEEGNVRALHPYPYEGADTVCRAQWYYPHEEKNKDGKTLLSYPHEEKNKDGKTLLGYPHEEKNKDGKTLLGYPHEEKNKDGETLLGYPHEEEEKGRRTQQYYPYEEKDEVERTQQHHSYEEENKVGRTQKHDTDEDDGKTLHHDSHEEEERDNRTLEHYSAEEDSEDGIRQHLDAVDKEDSDSRTLHHVTDEEEEQDSRRQQNHTDEDKKEREVRQAHRTFEGQDSGMHTSDQHDQHPQGQDRAARSVSGGHHWKGPSRGHTSSWRKNHTSGEDNGYVPPWRHQYSWAHRSHPYFSGGHQTQRQGQHCNSGPYYRNSNNSHYSSALNGGYTGSRGDEGGVMKPEELAEALVECPSFRSTLTNLFTYKFLNPKSVQQVAAAHPQVFHLNKNGVQLQPQIKLCQAYPSAQGCPNNLSCPDLHVCNTYVSSWCSEKPCPLGHSLYTDHNKAILEMFCLAYLPPHHLRKLLQHLTTTTPSPSSCLDVCQGYNRGQCDAFDCQALHLCLSFVVGRGRCGRPKCSLNHNPNTPGCSRLLSAHGISVNETIMDIIVALLSCNPTLTAADATVPSTPERTPNTQDSHGGADFKKPSNFFDRVKQRLGLHDNSSTRKTNQESYSLRNRESAAHYKSDKDSQELGAVGGQESTKSSNDYVPQRQAERRSSSGRSATGRTEGSQRAVWAYHRQGKVGVSEICRFSVESVCLKEDKGCSRLHASRPFHWQVCDGEGQDSWLNLPGTTISCLETAFCDPAKNGVRLPPLNPAHLRRLENVLDQDTWYANFEAMVLTNSDYSKVAALRRLCVQAGAATPYAKSRTYSWYFCDINGRWIKYGQADTSGQASRASSITSADIEAHYLARPNVPLSFKVSQFTYQVNFGAMTQTNQTTKVQRAVRRRPELYVDASTQKAHTGTRATSSVRKSE